MKDILTLVISLYAALLSTLVFLWRVYEFYVDRNGRLLVTIVENEMGTPIKIQDLSNSVKRIPDDIEGYDPNWKKILTIEILNIGKNNRAIELPIIRLRQKKTKRTEQFFNPAQMAKNYPLNLQPGECFKIQIPLEHLNDWVRKYTVEIQCMVVDTYKKVYKSKWQKI